jgi:hypothetical protein
MMMTERAQNFMNSVWSIRNSDENMTEEQLLSSVLKLVVEQVTSYNTQNDLIVLDKSDLLQLAEELASL